MSTQTRLSVSQTQAMPPPQPPAISHGVSRPNQSKYVEWTPKEKLSLVQYVQKCGEQWPSVSRQLRASFQSSHPSDYFSQKNCATQFSLLAKDLEVKRKRKPDLDSPIKAMLKNATIEFLEENERLSTQDSTRSKYLEQVLVELKKDTLSEDSVNELYEDYRNDMTFGIEAFPGQSEEYIEDEDLREQVNDEDNKAPAATEVLADSSQKVAEDNIEKKSLTETYITTPPENISTSLYLSTDEEINSSLTDRGSRTAATCEFSPACKLTTKSKVKDSPDPFSMDFYDNEKETKKVSIIESAPTLSMLLELPLSVPGAPLPNVDNINLYQEKEQPTQNQVSKRPDIETTGMAQQENILEVPYCPLPQISNCTDTVSVPQDVEEQISINLSVVSCGVSDAISHPKKIEETMLVFNNQKCLEQSEGYKTTENEANFVQKIKVLESQDYSVSEREKLDTTSLKKKESSLLSISIDVSDASAAEGNPTLIMNQNVSEKVEGHTSTLFQGKIPEDEQIHHDAAPYLHGQNEVGFVPSLGFKAPTIEYAVMADSQNDHNHTLLDKIVLPSQVSKDTTLSTNSDINAGDVHKTEVLSKTNPGELPRRIKSKKSSEKLKGHRDSASFKPSKNKFLKRSHQNISSSSAISPEQVIPKASRGSEIYPKQVQVDLNAHKTLDEVTSEAIVKKLNPAAAEEKTKRAKGKIISKHSPGKLKTRKPATKIKLKKSTEKRESKDKSKLIKAETDELELKKPTDNLDFQEPAEKLPSQKITAKSKSLRTIDKLKFKKSKDKPKLKKSTKLKSGKTKDNLKCKAAIDQLESNKSSRKLESKKLAGKLGSKRSTNTLESNNSTAKLNSKKLVEKGECKKPTKKLASKKTKVKPESKSSTGQLAKKQFFEKRECPQKLKHKLRSKKPEDKLKSKSKGKLKSDAHPGQLELKKRSKNLISQESTEYQEPKKNIENAEHLNFKGNQQPKSSQGRLEFSKLESKRKSEDQHRVKKSKDKQDSKKSKVKLDSPKSKVKLDSTKSKVKLDSPKSKVKLDSTKSKVKLDSTKSKVKLDSTKSKVKLDSTKSKVKLNSKKSKNKLDSKKSTDTFSHRKSMECKVPIDALKYQSKDKLKLNTYTGTPELAASTGPLASKKSAGNQECKTPSNKFKSKKIKYEVKSKTLADQRESDASTHTPKSKKAASKAETLVYKYSTDKRQADTETSHETLESGTSIVKLTATKSSRSASEEKGRSTIPPKRRRKTSLVDSLYDAANSLFGDGFRISAMQEFNKGLARRTRSKVTFPDKKNEAEESTPVETNARKIKLTVKAKKKPGPVARPRINFLSLFAKIDFQSFHKLERQNYLWYIQQITSRGNKGKSKLTQKCMEDSQNAIRNCLTNHPLCRVKFPITAMKRRKGLLVPLDLTCISARIGCGRYEFFTQYQADIYLMLANLAVLLADCPKRTGLLQDALAQVENIFDEANPPLGRNKTPTPEETSPMVLEVVAATCDAPLPVQTMETPTLEGSTPRKPSLGRGRPSKDKSRVSTDTSISGPKPTAKRPVSRTGANETKAVKRPKVERTPKRLEGLPPRQRYHRSSASYIRDCEPILPGVFDTTGINTDKSEPEREKRENFSRRTMPMRF